MQKFNRDHIFVNDIRSGHTAKLLCDCKYIDNEIAVDDPSLPAM